MPYEPSGAVPTSTVTSVTNWAPVCTVPGQPSVACAAWLRAGMNAVATLASAMLAQGSERVGLLWPPPFTFGIFPRAAGIVPGASRESRAPGVVFAARSARDRMTMDQPRLGRHRDDENPSRRRAEPRTAEAGEWRDPARTVKRRLVPRAAADSGRQQEAGSGPRSDPAFS